VPERVLWIGVTAFFLAVIVLLAFSPRVLAGNQEVERQEYMKILQDVLEFVQNYYVDDKAVDTKVLMEGALKGMFEALQDPHSAYLTSEDMRDMSDTTTGRFGGVGLIISKVEKGAEVVSPIEGTPADRAGVAAGDIITAIDGNPVVDLSVNEVVSILRGEVGSEVTMTLLRGKSLTFDVKVARAMIEVPTVRQAMIPGGIGYLRIIQFTPLTPPRVKDALGYFQKEKYQALIVDLRSNPGGVLSSVIETADYFLSDGPIVSTRSRIPSENHEYFASPRDNLVDASIPVIVLIDRGSASASEILAGALKDTGRATLLGEKSYGKGSVQQIRTIGDGGFRLTMSRYYTPSGISIDKIGILPDVEIKEPELTKEEEASFTRLIEENRIPAFVEQHPDPNREEVQSFVQALASEGLTLREPYVLRMIHNEVNRTRHNQPVYDLEYDNILTKAVDILRNRS
jgi:carboxyl-terminal processing protease